MYAHVVVRIASSRYPLRPYLRIMMLYVMHVLATLCMCDEYVCMLYMYLFMYNCIHIKCTKMSLEVYVCICECVTVITVLCMYVYVIVC